jgi:hypothetical protein
MRASASAAQTPGDRRVPALRSINTLRASSFKN